MNLRTGIATLVATFLFLCAFARAATPLPPGPVNGWCSDGSNSTGYFGVRGCPTQPPPAGDPGAYATLGVTWIVHGIHLTRVTDVTQLANLFGHIDPSQPVQGWPFVSGTNITYQDTSPKYLRLRYRMPDNPGTLPHKIKATIYLHSPWSMTARMAVVTAGGAWPTVASTCYKPIVAFDDQSNITVAPANAYGACVEPPGSTFDVLIDLNGSGGIASLTWN